MGTGENAVEESDTRREGLSTWRRERADGSEKNTEEVIGVGRQHAQTHAPPRP